MDAMAGILWFSFLGVIVLMLLVIRGQEKDVRKRYIDHVLGRRL